MFLTVYMDNSLYGLIQLTSNINEVPGTESHESVHTCSTFKNIWHVFFQIDPYNVLRVETTLKSL